METYHRQTLFPHINTEYPGVQLVHARPYIFIVNNFLSPEECELLLRKAKRLTPQQSGAAEGRASKRRSSGCLLHTEEVPTFRERVAALTAQDTSQLQPLKISRYRAGDFFGPHTDAMSSGPGKLRENPHDAGGDLHRAKLGVTAAPYPGGNRFMTMFVYLNDVEHGGRTRWRWVHEDSSFYDHPGPIDLTEIPWSRPDDETGVCIAPEAGMAVLHFASTTPETGGLTDRNACHESEEAVDTKWICQQFIYSHPIVESALVPGESCPREGTGPDLSLTF
jgi:hypothetical protein